MDTNVCSRRVHDGYATIRSRGRSRPRAVYRSDSEELLKEAKGPYALAQVSHSSQVPRWSDLGREQIFENYGTLRKPKCGAGLEERSVPVLNTFCAKTRSGKKFDKNSQSSVSSTEKISEVKSDAKNCAVDSAFGKETTRADESKDNFEDPVKNNVIIENNKRVNGGKERQPIYAIPNVPRLNNKPRLERQIAIDGNYVPSGDLYRSTARYIEDINRNIAEIDKNYEELRSANNRNSTYGVINKIAKGDKAESSPGNVFGGFHRKRDMAPMPPISPNFGETVEERNLEFDFKVPNGTAKKSKSRPNSYGKLPPKILPRSSSIENTSRHSTSSASSTKSTESLYAISEALIELPKNRVTFHKVSMNGAIGAQDYRPPIPKRTQFKTYRTGSSDSCDLDPDRDEFLDPSEANGMVLENRSREDTLDFQGNRTMQDNSRRSETRSVRHPQDTFARTHQERRYGTLPYRKSKIIPRPLHKSSEDVLDGDRSAELQVQGLQRSCMSTLDVRNHVEDRTAALGNFGNGRLNFLPLCLMDATDVILNGQLARYSKDDITPGGTPEDGSKAADHYAALQAQFRGESFETVKEQSSGRFCTRTRHNSLESEMDEKAVPQSQNFATLPRRGNASRDPNLTDTPKRLSGTVSTLEPLYEHAVSDPVKPRSTENVIPWWELATRKYRHRSCPSLQAHVVSAFEQSLSNMTQRLQQLTATAEKKDSELQELRDTIERLRKQSAEAGLNSASSSNGRRHTLGDSEGTTGCTGSNNHQGSSIARQLSADSVTSLNSLSSACSASSHHKKKGWLRSSFSKAFSRSRKNRHGSVSDAEDCKDGPGELSAPNSPRLPTAAKHELSQGHGPGHGTRSNGQKSPEHENGLTGSKSSSALYKTEDEDVDELKKQLREKDMVLTDIRLEALSSAHQLESLKDTVIKMRNEMLNLKQNNERLQRLVTSKSLTSSQSSLPSDPERRFSMTEVASSVAALSNGDNTTAADQLEDLNVPEHPVVPSTAATTNEPHMEQDTDGKRISVAVYLGSEKTFNFNMSGNPDGASDPAHCVIASVCISNKTSWDALDSTVRRCFKEYVSRVDPVTNLGLGVECVAAYHLGEASRCTTDSQHPELLPCGYLVGHVKTIYLVLSGYSWLAVDTLIPRSIVQRLVSLLTEHRRVILCGPSGTGKSYLAGKLAHALVDADTDTKDAAAVATFNVDHKSSKELRQYLAHIAERCDSNAADELPRVIILENLQHAASLGELFSGLLGTRHSSCPAIIGTMSQATCSTTNLQLHHNFRWVLCANHMEPVKGFLGRYLRRKLLEHELRESGGARNAEMAAVVEWIPRVWLHLNKFLETHSSSDVTIGPRLFLSCPMEVAGSQVWFTDLWNYSVIPYLVEAVREGLTLYGRRVSGNGNSESSWEDPAQFITSSYPWISTHAVHGGSDALLRLRPEDVGYDVVTSGHSSGVGASSVKSLGSAHSDTEGDPLLNMLMRLQEAANYSSPHSNDSDSVTSMDSSHTRHSEDLSSSTSSSRGVESAL